jgi:hypothetical protein
MLVGLYDTSFCGDGKENRRIELLCNGGAGLRRTELLSEQAKPQSVPEASDSCPDAKHSDLMSDDENATKGKGNPEMHSAPADRNLCPDCVDQEHRANEAGGQDAKVRP